MTARVLAAWFVIALAGRAHAESVRSERPPERDPSPLRLVVLGAATTLYITTDYLVEGSIAPATCRWCAPPGFDANVRDRAVWGDRGRAARLSDLTAFVATPVVAGGLLAVAASDAPCPSRRFFRDIIPVVEAGIYTHLISQTVKYTVGRRRPEIHFDGTSERSSEDNLSFFSAHTAVVFSVGISSAIVARRRGYKVERALWASTIAIGATTAYLRLAADKHYLSDVLLGAAIGTAGGYLIPQLGTATFGEGARITPTSNGIAVVGGF